MYFSLSVTIACLRLHLLLILVVAVEGAHEPVILKKLFSFLYRIVSFYKSITLTIPILLLKAINFTKHIHCFTDQQRFLDMFPSLYLVFIDFATCIKTLVIFGDQIIFDGLWFSTLKDVHLDVIFLDKGIVLCDGFHDRLWVA